MVLRRCLCRPVSGSELAWGFSHCADNGILEEREGCRDGCGEGGVQGRAILDQDVETLLDGERGIEDDESEAEWQHIVTIAGFEEVANGTL